MFLNEVADECRDVFLPFAQGRHDDWKHAKAVIEVAAKCARGDHLGQIAVGGGDQPSVHANCADASQALELLFLKHAQKLGLEFERYVSYFIQKNRPAVRQLESADALRDSPSKCAALVAKQLRFKQACWDRRAIYFHKRVLAPGTQIMNRASDQFLSRAGFPLDENGGVGQGHGFDLLQDGAQQWAFAHNFLEVHLRANFVFQVEFLLRQLVLQFRDFPEREGVFHRDSDLSCYLDQQVHVALLKRGVTQTCKT